MDILSVFLLFFQIFVIYKYLIRLKSVEDMYKDNIQDYFELKAQNAKLECFINDLNNEIKKLKDLHNEK